MHLLIEIWMISLFSKYFQKFKEYKKTHKIQKKKIQREVTNMLNDDVHKNPQASWTIIDEMKRDAIQTDKS